MAIGIIGGEGKPKIIWGGSGTNTNTWTCEYPQRFKDKFVEEFQKHELIDKDIEKKCLGYRWECEIEWEYLNQTDTSGEVEGLIYILNWLQASDNRTIKFYPHNDNDFYVEVYLDGDYELGKIGEKDKYTGHSLALKFKSKKLVPYLPGYYGFATGNDDSSGYWSNPANVYDAKTNTYASHASAAIGYTDYLTITFDECLVNKLAFYVQASNNDDVLIEVYNVATSSWNIRVNEGIQTNTFVEKDMPVTLSNKIRIRFNLGSVQSVSVAELLFAII